MIQSNFYHKSDSVFYDFSTFSSLFHWQSIVPKGTVLDRLKHFLLKKFWRMASLCRTYVLFYYNKIYCKFINGAQHPY